MDHILEVCIWHATLH